MKSPLYSPPLKWPQNVRERHKDEKEFQNNSLQIISLSSIILNFIFFFGIRCIQLTAATNPQSEETHDIHDGKP